MFLSWGSRRGQIRGGRHSSPRSMFIRPNYKLGNGSDHNNAKKYGPYFVNPYWVGLEKHCFLIWRKMGNFREMIICFKLPICKTQQQAPKYLIRACLLYVVNITQMFDLNFLAFSRPNCVNKSITLLIIYLRIHFSLFYLHVDIHLINS